ncbi:MAG: hypothetical protein EA426_02825 [Spirochaetaceae bacterium]|nr:MAG: hypothetical protein EA426_02825 [Spirochaetaceae bacterium]
MFELFGLPSNGLNHRLVRAIIKPTPVSLPHFGHFQFLNLEVQPASPVIRNIANIPGTAA